MNSSMPWSATINRIYYANEFIFITCYSNVYTPLRLWLCMQRLLLECESIFPLGPALVKLEPVEDNTLKLSNPTLFDQPHVHSEHIFDYTSTCACGSTIIPRTTGKRLSESRRKDGHAVLFIY